MAFSPTAVETALPLSRAGVGVGAGAGAASDVVCAHCGLPVPASEREHEGPFPRQGSRSAFFCCQGCRTVYAVIREHGLGSYYRERARAGDTAPRPARTTRRTYDELDDAAFAHEHYRANSDHECAVELYVEGVHCSACVWLIENLPRAASGVREARLDAGRSLLRVTWDPRAIALSGIARRLDSLGYPPHPAVGDRAEAELASDRTLLMRIGLAGFSAGNVMLMAFALYGGAFTGMEAEYASLFRAGSLALALPALLFGAAPFYRGALASLRTRTPHMDLPIAIGISIGFVWSTLNTLRGVGEVYFDSISTLIFLLLIGRFLQQRHHRRAASAADLALALGPSTARVRSGSDVLEVQASRIAPGSLVEVASGERIPVDGVVEHGSSSIDASLLTGESRPEDVKLGDRVYAGTTNVGEAITIVARAAGGETRVGKLVASIESAQRERPPIVRLADRIAGRFVFAVLALAALTLAVWWAAGPGIAIEHAVALLVVTCPCALGMATPLAVSVALRRAASTGLLFKGGEHLETLARPGTIVFDKTGTLTEGQPKLVEYDGPQDLLGAAAVVERSAEHPLAKALRRAAPAEAEAAPATNVELLPGRGLRGVVRGELISVGSRALFEGLGIVIPKALCDKHDAQAERGLTPVLIARGDEAEALAAFGDELRPEAAQVLSELARLGYRLRVLSGDDPRVVRRVCAKLSLDECRGGLGPEQKLARVRELAQSGEPVVMVGDGVNDAAAMAAAAVGFAVHGGAEASLLAAHVFSTRSGVKPVLDAVRGARRTMTVIRRGIAFSLLYNLLGIGLALTGILGPLLAAILMPVSSLTVVSSALGSRAFKEPS